MSFVFSLYFERNNHKIAPLLPSLGDRKDSFSGSIVIPVAERNGSQIALRTWHSNI